MKSMQKPKIGISLRVVEAPSYDEKRDALSHDWPKLLEKLGFNPIYIPNTLSHVDEFFSDMSLDGLILSGGDNIGENKNRDETENLLLKLAIEKRIPVLGVCRGMQLINNYFGGDMSIDNTTEHISKNHDVEITDKSFFSLFNSDILYGILMLQAFLTALVYPLIAKLFDSDPPDVKNISSGIAPIKFAISSLDF